MEKIMKYFAALLKMKDPEKNRQYHQQHVEFLQQKEKEGKIYARGRFAGGDGGLAIYIAESMEEATTIAQSDPYVVLGARALELYEWDMKVVPGQ
jgi:uncharacterized protein YciI